jgi:histidinol dehydrogenase
VDDFVKKTQYTYYTKEALERVARDVEFFATKEGLTAHAKSAVVRLEDAE